MNPTTRIYIHVLGIAGMTGLFFWFIDGYFEFIFFHQNLSFLVLEGPETLLESLFFKVPGHSLFVRVSFAVACVISGFIVAKFLSKQKKVEVSLRENEEKFRTLIRSIPDLVWLKDPKGTYLFCNPRFENFFGATEKEIIGKTDYDFVDKKLADFFRKHDEKATTEGTPRKNEEKVTFADGHREILETIKTPMYKSGGQLVGVLGIGRDITSRKQAEKARLESETKYRSMLESITDQLYICSPEFTVEYMNPAMINRIGRDATGETCHCALHGLDHPCDWCDFDKVAKGKSIEITIISPLDGRNYRVTNMPVQHQDGTISKMSIFRDITDFLTAVADKDKAQAQLLQSQKMDSIGNLAGGIAHDFNNILYPIIGFAEMSLEELPEAHPVKENLEDILQGAKRARDLVKQLLAFSSQREVEQKHVLLAPLIQEILKLLRAVIPSNIDIRQELYDASDYILANPTEIHEVVMNLCTNAYHAMEKTGGTISVYLNKTEPAPDVNLPHGDYCSLRISDTGTGIPPEIINTIFDPYFTTKEVGKGSGLGLSVVHGIVKNHQGAITVESKPGKGTVFNVYLPIISAITDSDEKLKDQPNPGGDEKILFVDDEEPIVKLGVRLLEKLGYKVTGKNSSREALALFESSPDAFDLVITDMAMPEMVGTEFATKLMETRPDIPIIICTGFSEGIDGETAASLGIKDYINKPILTIDLSSKVRAVLDQSKKG